MVMNSSGLLSADSLSPVGLTMYMAMTVLPYLLFLTPTSTPPFSLAITCGKHPSSTGYSTKTTVSSATRTEFATASNSSAYTISSYGGQSVTISYLASGGIPTDSGWRNARNASAHTTLAAGSPSSAMPVPNPPSFHVSNPHRSMLRSQAPQQFWDMSTKVQCHAPRLRLSSPTEPDPLKMSKCRVLQLAPPASSYMPKLVNVEYTASRTLPIMGRRYTSGDSSFLPRTDPPSMRKFDGLLYRLASRDCPCGRSWAASDPPACCDSDGDLNRRVLEFFGTTCPSAGRFATTRRLRLGAISTGSSWMLEPPSPATEERRRRFGRFITRDADVCRLTIWVDPLKQSELLICNLHRWQEETNEYASTAEG
mmetsp:Transcript_13645/g.29576  ORF Transcript_13645/g.29576 Transcript_13645/m.29576 type:complete len:367 (-) Transcript_13645:286-1386(-)